MVNGYHIPLPSAFYFLFFFKAIWQILGHSLYSQELNLEAADFEHKQGAQLFPQSSEIGA